MPLQFGVRELSEALWKLGATPVHGSGDGGRYGGKSARV